ncbi:hypothetical protein ACFL1G_00170 [Planctomycetota bacterium]
MNRAFYITILVTGILAQTGANADTLYKEAMIVGGYSNFDKITRKYSTIKDVLNIKLFILDNDKVAI